MRSGLSLEDLSARTKVSVELWDAMERNDFSRWPAGVAARSYIRSYAAVGADPNATVDEFCLRVLNAITAERLVRGQPKSSAINWSERRFAARSAEGDRRAADASRAAHRVGSRHIPRRDRSRRRLAVVTLVVVDRHARKIDFWMTLASAARCV